MTVSLPHEFVTETPSSAWREVAPHCWERARPIDQIAETEDHEAFVRLAMSTAIQIEGQPEK